MTIYIDNDCKCHTTNQDGNLQAFDVPFFDGKCDAYIEGYRYLPPEMIWTREDGVVFRGEMIAPWKPYSELDSSQRAYERELLAELKAENDMLVSDMAQIVDDIYQSDIETLGI